MKNSLITPIGTVGECNTTDVLFADCCLLDRRVIPEVLYRNEYGYVVFCKPGMTPTEKATTIQYMHELGFSEKFLEVFVAAHEAGHRYLVIDQAAAAGREEEDPSWDDAKTEEFVIDSVDALKPTAKALSKEALEEIFEYVAGGLWVDMLDSNEEIINPNKSMPGSDWKTHLETILKKHHVSIPE